MASLSSPHQKGPTRKWPEWIEDCFSGWYRPWRRGAPLVFARVDVDDNRALAKTFGVTSAPFVAVLKHKRW